MNCKTTQGEEREIGSSTSSFYKQNLLSSGYKLINRSCAIEFGSRDVKRLIPSSNFLDSYLILFIKRGVLNE